VSAPRAEGQQSGPPGTIHQQVLAVLTDPRWYWVLVPAGVAAFVLGCIGYWSYNGGDHSVSDVVYDSIRLFLPSASQPEKYVGVSLNIARYLAPIVAGWAALIALVSLFRDRMQQMLIPLKRGHVVLCGLGYVGFEFLRQLRNAGYRVVVIEADAANQQIETCRGSGIPVIVGDAQLRPTLEAAGIRRAARLLAVTPESAVNTEIVTRALELVYHTDNRGARAPQGDRGGRLRRRSSQLRCLARIDDPDLCVLLLIEQSNRGDDESALDFFSTEEIGARLLLEAHPIDTERQAHILVAHLDGLGAGLVFHAARKWHDERKDNPAPLLVSVVDDHADERVSSLLSQYESLEQVCEFSCYRPSVRDIDRLAAIDRDRRSSRAHGAYRDDTAPPPISRAYVTAYRDEQTVATALNLHHALDARVPVVAALSRAYGVAGLLEDAKTSSAVNLTVFKTLQETCNVELVEGGSFETIAHAIHQRYCEMQPADQAPLSPWSQLDPSFKESNRAQARHIGVKLRSIGCEITPLRYWRAKDFTLTDTEVEKLAKMEHDRWWREKETDGWIAGPRDDEHKINPYMVPWEDLPPEVAAWDRNFVRAIPEMLAAVGLQIVDIEKTASRYPDATASSRALGPDPL
jgi:voltage-gated potassium channel Kch